MLKKNTFEGWTFEGIGVLVKKGRLLGFKFDDQVTSVDMRKSMHCLMPKNLHLKKSISIDQKELVYFNRFAIMAKCKEFDTRNDGLIKREKLLKLIESCGVPGLEIESFADYMEGFGDEVDYRKLIEFISKEGKNKVMIRKETIDVKDRNYDKEIEVLKVILPKLITQTYTSASKELSLKELQNLLRLYSVVLSVEVLKDVLARIGVSEISLNNFISGIQKAKVKFEDYTNDDIVEILRSLETKLDLKELSKLTFEEMSKVLNNILQPLEIKLIHTHLQENGWKQSDLQLLAKIENYLEIKKLSAKEAFFFIGDYKIIERERITIDDFKRFIESFGKFTRNETQNAFDKIDTNKDNIIDLTEWTESIKSIYKEGDSVKRIIRSKCLTNAEVEGLLDLESPDIITIETLRNRVTRIDSSIPRWVTTAIFDTLQKGNLVELFNLKALLTIENREDFNLTNDSVFLNNFKEALVKNTTFDKLLSSFELKDRHLTGSLEDSLFFKALSENCSQFKANEVEKYIQSKNFKNASKVEYMHFLADVFDDSKRDKLNIAIEFLESQNLDVVFAKGAVTVTELAELIASGVSGVNRNLVCLFDIDRDGKVTRKDVETLLTRSKTKFTFKTNNLLKNKINITPRDTISEKQFKEILFDMRTIFEREKMSLEQVFAILDSSKQGVITLDSFCANIDRLIKISPFIKESVFNKLDKLKTRLIDKKTFFSFFANDNVKASDWNTEQRVLEEMKKYLKKNSSYSNIEIFSMIDYNFDGTIDADDFFQFCIKKLKFNESKISPKVVNRVLQELSSLKENKLTLADISKEIEYNRKWAKTTVVKLALLISKKHGCLQDFFNKWSVDSKISLAVFSEIAKDLVEWQRDLYLNDEDIVCIFSHLDRHKKGYLEFEDLANKLGTFNFDDRVRKDIKNYLKSVFSNSIEGFKFFLKGSDSMEKKELINFTVRKSELLIGLKRIFKNKYSSGQLNGLVDKEFPNGASLFSFASQFFDSKLDEGSSAGTLKTRFDGDPLEKIRRLIRYSKLDCETLLKVEESLSRGWVNESEFRNLIKRLNLGISNYEINEMITKVDKNSLNQLNIREFNRYVLRPPEGVDDIKQNSKQVLSHIKHKIYKYFGNPRACFLMVTL